MLRINWPLPFEEGAGRGCVAGIGKRAGDPNRYAAVTSVAVFGVMTAWRGTYRTNLDFWRIGSNISEAEMMATSRQQQVGCACLLALVGAELVLRQLTS